jgi:hypothetical protein
MAESNDLTKAQYDNLMKMRGVVARTRKQQALQGLLGGVRGFAGLAPAQVAQPTIPSEQSRHALLMQEAQAVDNIMKAKHAALLRAAQAGTAGDAALLKERRVMAQKIVLERLERDGTLQGHKAKEILGALEQRQKLRNAELKKKLGSGKGASAKLLGDAQAATMGQGQSVRFLRDLNRELAQAEFPADRLKILEDVDRAREDAGGLTSLFASGGSGDAASEVENLKRLQEKAIRDVEDIQQAAATEELQDQEDIEAVLGKLGIPGSATVAGEVKQVFADLESIFGGTGGRAEAAAIVSKRGPTADPDALSPMEEAHGVILEKIANPAEVGPAVTSVRQAVMASPDFKKFMTTNGFEPGAEIQAFKALSDKWRARNKQAKRKGRQRRKEMRGEEIRLATEPDPAEEPSAAAEMASAPSDKGGATRDPSPTPAPTEDESGGAARWEYYSGDGQEVGFVFDAAGNVIEVVTDIGRAGELNAQLGAPTLNSYSNIPPELEQKYFGVGPEDQKAPSPEEGGGDAEPGEKVDEVAEESGWRPPSEMVPAVRAAKRELGKAAQLIEDYTPPLADRALLNLPSGGRAGLRALEAAVDPALKGGILDEDAVRSYLGAGEKLVSAGKQAVTPKKGLPPVKVNMQDIQTSADDLIQRQSGNVSQMAEIIKKRLVNLAKRNSE